MCLLKYKNKETEQSVQKLKKLLQKKGIEYIMKAIIKKNPK